MIPFKVGEEVVCVDDTNTIIRTYSGGGVEYRGGELEKGKIYKIRWIGAYTQPDGTEAICVRLMGVRRRSIHPSTRDPDAPFFASRFRPLMKNEDAVEDSTRSDPRIGKRVDELKKLLNGIPVRVTENA